jgi:5,6-dimethylbenzimidazole synthase
MKTGHQRFDAEFRASLDELFRWRRDVRRFRADPLPEGLAEELLAAADTAPSVGLSQPWRYVRVSDPARRACVRATFERANRHALAGYEGERARLYAGLKLAGIERAPLQLAVFVDRGTEQGHGLGRATMPEMLAYSVVCSIHTLWLAARARGVGLGWVSILEPAEVAAALEVPKDWSLVAWLCLGSPEEDQPDPELERVGWEERRATLLLER